MWATRSRNRGGSTALSSGSALKSLRSWPLRASYRVPSVGTASYQEAMTDYEARELVNTRTCLRRLGSGRPGPGPNPDTYHRGISPALLAGASVTPAFSLGR